MKIRFSRSCCLLLVIMVANIMIPMSCSAANNATNYYYSDTKPVFYSNSLYEQYYGCSHQEYVEALTELDDWYGRRRNHAGQIEGIEIGEEAEFYLYGSEYSAYGFLNSLVYNEIDRYGDSPTDLDMLLSHCSEVQLVESELYGWGMIDGIMIDLKEYYRFYLNDDTRGVQYDVLYEVGGEYDGGDWCDSKVVDVWKTDTNAEIVTEAEEEYTEALACHVERGWNGQFMAYETDEVTFEDCYASSLLEDQYGIYYMENCFDHNSKTTWAEGEKGDGIGQSITGIWTSKTGEWWITGIALKAGYQKSEDIYYKNNRPRGVEVFIYSDVSEESYSYLATLEDYLGGQCIVFDDWIPIKGPMHVAVAIYSVYRGNKYSDTCISEMDLLVSPTSDRGWD